jgi:hypothetical protein
MAKKRSKSTQETVSILNTILAQKQVMVGNSEGRYEMVSAQSEVGMSYKLGICDAIEAVLHHSNSYHGFRYLYGDNPNCKFERQYY